MNSKKAGFPFRRKTKNRDPMRIRVSSYNIHGCVDDAGRANPDKVAQVIAGIDADIVALQEVDAEKPFRLNRNQARIIGEAIGHRHLYFPVERTGRHVFGLAMLSRYPIEQSSFDLLPNLFSSLKMRKRGIMHVALQTPGGRLHVFNTHLSIYKLERQVQLGAILRLYEMPQSMRDESIVFCGDLNAGPSSLTHFKLSSIFNDVQKSSRRYRRSHATFPSKAPFFSFDHIFVSDHFMTAKVEVIINPLAVTASDHLPLVADLDFCRCRARADGLKR